MKLLTLLALVCLAPVYAHADDAMPAEIDYLLESIGSSACIFIRNDKRYDAKTAEDHLRMKYSRGKRYAPTGEKFIERLASKSYLTKRPYFIECDGEEKVLSGDWLMDRLDEFREGSTAEG